MLVIIIIDDYRIRLSDEKGKQFLLYLIMKQGYCHKFRSMHDIFMMLSFPNFMLNFDPNLNG